MDDQEFLDLQVSVTSTLVCKHCTTLYCTFPDRILTFYYLNLYQGPKGDPGFPGGPGGPGASGGKGAMGEMGFPGEC